MKNLLLIILLSLSFNSTYNVGDKINMGHQNMEFDICYGSDLDPNGDGVFQLAELNGDLNGGNYYVTVIEMSASWWPSCYTSLSSFDNFYSLYDDNDNVFVFTTLADIGQPYSCYQWGNGGTSGIPLVTDDSGSPIWNLFNTGNYFPSTVFIDHTMTVYYQDSGWSSTYATTKVNEMLDNLENSLILAISDNINIINGDNDNILNPGEEFELIFTISNNSFYIDASNVQANISNSNNIIFNTENLNFGDIDINQSSSFILNGVVSSDSNLGDESFEVNIISDYIDNFGNEQSTEITYDLIVNISLNQEGFPFDANSEIKPSPLVIDFLGNNQNQILFGDNNGLIHIVDSNGEEVVNNVFPFDTGNQIWGSFASGNINEDENVDIAVVSKSKHLYVLDKDGLILDYNANKFLIGTPALGNLDSDEDLEIIFETVDVAIENAQDGNSGVIGFDEDNNNKLSCIDFNRIRGGKPFDTDVDWFLKIMKQIGQIN